MLTLMSRIRYTTVVPRSHRRQPLLYILDVLISSLLCCVVQYLLSTHPDVLGPQLGLLSFRYRDRENEMIRCYRGIFAIAIQKQAPLLGGFDPPTSAVV